MAVQMEIHMTNSSNKSEKMGAETGFSELLHWVTLNAHLWQDVMRCTNKQGDTGKEQAVQIIPEEDPRWDLQRLWINYYKGTERTKKKKKNLGQKNQTKTKMFR